MAIRAMPNFAQHRLGLDIRICPVAVVEIAGHSDIAVCPVRYVLRHRHRWDRRLLPVATAAATFVLG
jgi:hypothetical protein